MKYPEHLESEEKHKHRQYLEVASTWDSDYEFEHFDDAAVQPENSEYHPIPKNINEFVYEEEIFWKREWKHKKHKKLCLHSFKCGIVRMLCFQTEA